MMPSPASEPSCWGPVGLAELPILLQQHRLVLVEFWAPDCLFSRLWQPVRQVGAQRLAGRVPMVRCAVSGAEPALVGWRLWALPAMVMFKDGKPRVRWIGETHWSVLMHSIERHLLVRAGA